MHVDAVRHLADQRLHDRQARRDNWTCRRPRMRRSRRPATSAAPSPTLRIHNDSVLEEQFVAEERLERHPAVRRQEQAGDQQQPGDDRHRDHRDEPVAARRASRSSPAQTLIATTMRQADHGRRRDRVGDAKRRPGADRDRDQPIAGSCRASRLEESARTVRRPRASRNASTLSRAAAINRARRPPSSSTRRIAAASSDGVGSTSSPLRSCSMISTVPGDRVATTGVPHGHRLDEHIAKTFVGRCQHEDIRARDELPRVGLKSPEADARGHAELARPAARARRDRDRRRGSRPSALGRSCASASSNSG